MRKGSILLIGLLSMSVSTTWAQSSEFETAKEAVANMAVGWNLGNTLDSNSGDTLNMWIEHWTSRTPSDYEKAWGQPVTKASLMKMFKDAGFNAIRVPVTWYPHMEAKFSFTSSSNSIWYASKDDLGTEIKTAWMNRVKQIVDYVIDAGMYCILNVHHDTGASNTAWLVADEDIYSQQRERFEAIWTQIAEEFRDYDEHLLFEGYNEMLDVKDSWCFASFAASGGYDASIATSAYNAINSYAQSFVNAVRATGGNNAQRNLIVNTYGACDGSGNWNSHLQDPLKQMKLPNDEVANHIIFEVHSYPDIQNLSSAKSQLTTTINNLKTHLVSKGAPVIFGEWGTSTDNAYDNYRSNMVNFYRYFVEQTKKNDMGTFHWMGLSDGDNRSVPKFNQQDLVDAIIKGYYGDGGYISGIEQVESENEMPADNEKVIYYLSGRRVNHELAKGIYIINGKKVVIK
ncbi:MAG: glycoside hydrolase family 5 protein [Prevotella sp.]|nr:glycoside hydrolase family 5 protein [Prevotella sp.]